MISAYSLSFPLLSLHFLNMTDASTLAGENVLGSLSKEITLSKIVLKKVTITAESEIMHLWILDVHNFLRCCTINLFGVKS